MRSYSELQPADRSFADIPEIRAKSCTSSRPSRSTGIRVRNDLLKFGLLYSPRRSLSNTNLPRGGSNGGAAVTNASTRTANSLLAPRQDRLGSRISNSEQRK